MRLYNTIAQTPHSSERPLRRLGNQPQLHHHGGELLRLERLGTVRGGVFRVGMDLDHQAVGAGRHCGIGHGCHVMVVAGSVGRIGYHRQVGLLLQHGDGGEVKGVAGGGLEGADSPLAEDDRLVTLAHDVLRAHQEFLDGHGHPPLEEHRPVQLTDLLQEGEILGIARSDLEDVGEVRGLKAPPRRIWAPAALTASADSMICCSLSTEQGPAMTMISLPPMATVSLIRMMLASFFTSLEASLYGWRMGSTLSTPGIDS